jgi:hypothetical protein
MKEQIQKYARKHIKGGCYLKVTLGHRGLKEEGIIYILPVQFKKMFLNITVYLL